MPKFKYNLDPDDRYDDDEEREITKLAKCHSQIVHERYSEDEVEKEDEENAN